MSLVTLDSLIENKFHLGHRTDQWDPRTAPYIHSAIRGYYIINLVQSAKMLTHAYLYLFKVAKRGHTFLFIGTKPEASNWIKKAALSCGSFYINQVWRSGLLTNWTFIRGRVRLLSWFQRVFSLMQDGHFFQSLPKGLILSLERRYQKLRLEMDGLVGLSALPKVVILIDPNFERQALKESIKLKRVLVSLVDTDCNPEPIHIPIPGNDNHGLSIKIFLQVLATAILRGKLVRYCAEAL